MRNQTNPNLFASLIGQTARGCWLGYGSVLFLEFGQSQLPHDRKNHPRGEFGLSCDHIECRIEKGEKVIAGSEDNRAAMESGIEEINGKDLISAELLQPSGDSILTFSDGLVLRSFVITSEEDARWTFCDRDGNYFHLGPDRAYPVEQPRLSAVHEPQ